MLANVPRSSTANVSRGAEGEWVASIEPETTKPSAKPDAGNAGNAGNAMLAEENAGNLVVDPDAGNLIDQVLAIVNAGNAGKIGDAGLRIEINKRVLKNGTTQLYWVWRKRCKGREFYAHGGTAETLAAQYPERLAKYRSRHNIGIKSVPTSGGGSPGGG